MPPRARTVLANAHLAVVEAGVDRARTWVALAQASGSEEAYDVPLTLVEMAPLENEDAP